jgi:hypothetical protein
MRLSWYADTGIAVFSIWQGGRCTGTFRLPMDDLARMTEILQRGPERQRGGGRRERGDYERAGYGEASYGEASYGEAGYGEQQFGEAGYGENQYDEASYDDDRYGEGRYDEDWFEEGNRAGGHGTDEYGAGERRAGEHGLTGGYPDRPGANRPSAGLDSAGYGRSAGYGDSAGYEQQAGYADFPANASASDATGRYEFPARAARPEDGSYLPAAPDHDGGAVTDLSRYADQRFVPPYVRSGTESYPNDNPPPGATRRHSAGGPAYPADRGGVSAEPGRYPMQPDSEAGYSGGSEYRPAADPGVTAQYSAGRHSGRRGHSSAPAPFAEPELDDAGEPISEQDYWRRQAR